MIDFIKGITAILILMAILLIVFIVDASVLFWRVLPEDMDIWLRGPVSVLMAIPLSVALLLTAVHSNHLPRYKGIGFPEGFSVISFGLTLFFFDLPAMPNRPTDWYALVIFLALCLAMVDYLLAFLFVRKLKELSEEERITEQVTDLQTSNKDLQEKVSALQCDADALQRTTEANQQLKEELQGYHKQHICKHCGKRSDTISANLTHQSRCPKRRANQKEQPEATK